MNVRLRGIYWIWMSLMWQFLGILKSKRTKDWWQTKNMPMRFGMQLQEAGKFRYVLPPKLSRNNSNTTVLQADTNFKHSISPEGIAKSAKQAGSFSNVCPILLPQPLNQSRLLCQIPGCTGKWLNPQSSNSESQKFRPDEGVWDIRRSCPLEVDGHKCFDWTHEHRELRAHRNEEGKEEEWECRVASAKLRAAHEKELWLVYNAKV